MPRDQVFEEAGFSAAVKTRKAEPYEPPLVAILRSLVRRGAPDSLLNRLAGGASAYRRLNASWLLDWPDTAIAGAGRLGSGAPWTRYEPLGVALSTYERRLTLKLICIEALNAGWSVPKIEHFSSYFECSLPTVEQDMGMLKGALAECLP